MSHNAAEQFLSDWSLGEEGEFGCRRDVEHKMQMRLCRHEAPSTAAAIDNAGAAAATAHRQIAAMRSQSTVTIKCNRTDQN